MQYKSKHIC